MNKKDAKWLFGIIITLIVGFWKIWVFDIEEKLIVPLIKLIFSIFWILAISVFAYWIIFKTKEKKNGKRK